MQKVEGSSPFIRFDESPAQAGFSVSSATNLPSALIAGDMLLRLLAPPSLLTLTSST